MQEVISDQQALKNIAANVHRLRADRSFSELARQCGTYPASIKRIEDGEHMPGAGLLARLAEALGVTVDALILSPGKNLSRAS